MNKNLTRFVLFVGLGMICNPSQVAGQVNDEINDLRRRITELEAQNREMLHIIREMQAKLNGNPQQGNVPSTIASKPSAEQAAPAADTEHGNNVQWPQLVSARNRMKFYGFLRLDTDIDSERPNAPQTPLYIASADPKLGGKPDAGNFSLHPRLTRFGVDYTGPEVASLDDAQLSGKLELDFENGGSESRQIIRIRHAYLQVQKDDFTILAGQTWDVFSPLYPTVNNDTLMWNAGNLGDRRPQFRVSYDPRIGRGRLSISSAAGLTGAIDAQDLDNNGYRDGEESGKPDYQGRVGYSYPLIGDQSASLGASFFYGWENTSRVLVGRTAFQAQAVNIDYTLPITRTLNLRGEGWWGRNMSDVRGGAGQGINLTTGREIRGRGGWSELSLHLSRIYSIHPGFTTDDPVDGDVPIGRRTRNQAFYLGNRITPGGNFTIGADYLYWRTAYKGASPGIDNRVNVFFQYAY